jgi:hypothetical protein
MPKARLLSSELGLRPEPALFSTASVWTGLILLPQMLCGRDQRQQELVDLRVVVSIAAEACACLDIASIQKSQEKRFGEIAIHFEGYVVADSKMVSDFVDHRPHGRASACQITQTRDKLQVD